MREDSVAEGLREAHDPIHPANLFADCRADSGEPVTAVPSLGMPDSLRVDASLVRLRRYADWLDSGIRLPLVGWRIGVDPLLGLVPGLGDALGAVLSGWILLTAARLRVALPTLLRMLLNIVIDLVGGAVPLVGDLFDAAWKSNTLNVALLERHQRVGLTGARAADRRFLIAIAATLGIAAVALVAAGIWSLWFFVHWIASW